MKEFTLKLEDSYKIAANALHLIFRREDGEALPFIPGQFLTFLLPSPDGIKRRSYSIASIPGKTNDIEIAISYIAGGIASETFFKLTKGSVLTGSGPFGRLILRPQETPKRFILVATGTGVAPYRAMLPELAMRMENDPQLQVVLLLGVQYRADFLYLEDFLTFAQQHPRFDFRAHLSRENVTPLAPYEYQGRVQTAFPNLMLDPAGDLVYLCGNPDMIDDAFAVLTDEGFAPQSVRREKYISSN
jgi:ferredoxin-NADP reductase